jgi:hypothetical protein
MLYIAQSFAIWCSLFPEVPEKPTDSSLTALSGEGKQEGAGM